VFAPDRGGIPTATTIHVTSRRPRSPPGTPQLVETERSGARHPEAQGDHSRIISGAQSAPRDLARGISQPGQGVEVRLIPGVLLASCDGSSRRGPRLPASIHTATYHSDNTRKVLDHVPVSSPPRPVPRVGQARPRSTLAIADGGGPGDETNISLADSHLGDVGPGE